jgi:hypothetical protein
VAARDDGEGKPGAYVAAGERIGPCVVGCPEGICPSAEGGVLGEAVDGGVES